MILIKKTRNHCFYFVRQIFLQLVLEAASADGLLINLLLAA